MKVGRVSRRLSILEGHLQLNSARDYHHSRSSSRSLHCCLIPALTSSSTRTNRNFGTEGPPATKPLTGKTAVVTGSTQGIGLGVAKELCKSGASVVINGFGDPKEIEKVRASLQAINNQPVFYISADLCKVNEIEEFIAESKRKLGKVDIVINNAGIQHVAPIEDFPVDKWQKILDLNLTSAFHTMRLTMPDMRARAYGRIINISSVHGIVASKHKAAYVAAKHGIVGLTKVAALEYAGTGVTSNCINPGWVLTDLVKAQIEAKAKASNSTIEEATRALLSEKQPSLTFADRKSVV